jgi:hypothetical protein
MLHGIVVVQSMVVAGVVTVSCTALLPRLCSIAAQNQSRMGKVASRPGADTVNWHQVLLHGASERRVMQPSPPPPCSRDLLFISGSE